MSLLSAPGWRQVDSAQGPVFRRPLGLTELGFYWDSEFNGVAVSVNHLELEVNEDEGPLVFAKENVELAWLRLKQRYPLLGASVEELPGSEQVEFVVTESALRQLRPGELNYVDLGSAEDAEEFSDRLHNGPTVLDREFLARVWYGQVKDSPRDYRVYIPVVHHITDGVGQATVTREFCRELVSLSKAATIVAPPLSTRLEVAMPLEAVGPACRLNLARRRWRLAIAFVIRNIQLRKLQVSFMERINIRIDLNAFLF